MFIITIIRHKKSAIKRKKKAAIYAALNYLILSNILDSFFNCLLSNFFNAFKSIALINFWLIELFIILIN